MMRIEDINNWFTCHAPSQVQQVAYTDLRNKAKSLAKMFNDCVPDCADKTAAMRHLRETVMAMNLAIACYQKPTIESLESILKEDSQPNLTINPDGSVSVDE